MFSKNEMNNIHPKKLLVTKTAIRKNCLEANIINYLFLNVHSKHAGCDKQNKMSSLEAWKSLSLSYAFFS